METDSFASRLRDSIGIVFVRLPTILGRNSDDLSTGRGFAVSTRLICIGELFAAGLLFVVCEAETCAFVCATINGLFDDDDAVAAAAVRGVPIFGTTL